MRERARLLATCVVTCAGLSAYGVEDPVIRSAREQIARETGREVSAEPVAGEHEAPKAAGGQLMPNVLGGEVGISGATLFRDFFEFIASTNDFINADCDFDCFSNPADCIGGALGDDCDPTMENCAYRGFNPDRTATCGITPVDVLASDLPTSGTTFDTWWLVNYRSVGSTNGVQDFVNSNVSFLNSLHNSPLAPNPDENEGYIGDNVGCTTECQNVDDQIWGTICGEGTACGTRCLLSCVCDELGIAEESCTNQAMCSNFGCNQPECCPCDLWIPRESPSEPSNINRQRYYTPEEGCVGDFAPDADCPDTCQFYCMTSVDLASTDVPVSWAIRTGEDQDALWDRKPTESGYGRNPRNSPDADFTNALKDLFFECNGIEGVQANETLNSNLGAPDARTVFNNFLARHARNSASR